MIVIYYIADVSDENFGKKLINILESKDKFKTEFMASITPVLMERVCVSVCECNYCYYYPSPTHSVWEGYCSRRVS